KDGSYIVMNIPEKQYILHKGAKVLYVGVADKKTVMSIVYHDPKKKLTYVKRFIVSQFMLEKLYRFVEEGMVIDFITTDLTGSFELQFVPMIKQRVATAKIQIEDFLIKGVSAKGVKASPREVKKIVKIQSKG
ncbi:MAG: DNA topoisomerase IV subunit A, partial [Parachlamydiaceae bacterium]|nr:DNA topoisomerase IV subunit A [Parachlamydiaceae bacterium]